MTALKKFKDIFKDSYHVPTSPSVFSPDYTNPVCSCVSHILSQVYLLFRLCSDCNPFDCLQQACDDLSIDVRQFATMLYVEPNPKQDSTNSEFGNRFWVNLVMFAVLAQPLKLIQIKKKKQKTKEGMTEGDQHKNLNCVQFIFHLWAKTFLKYQSSIQFCSDNPKNERKKKLQSGSYLLGEKTLKFIK